jgi:lipid A disaccharide synthetase
MVNLFLAPDGPAVAEELILEKCKPEFIARGLMDIYVDGAKREVQLKELARARGLLKPPAALGSSPSAAVANALFSAAQSKAQPLGIPT